MKKLFHSVFISIFVLLAVPTSSFAQNALGQHQSGTYRSERFMSGQISQGNEMSNCDATCTASLSDMSLPPPAIDVLGTQTQTLACPSGYSGTITQQRTVFANGNYSAWAETQNSCDCVGTFEQQNVSCPSPRTGSITQQRNFSCGTSSWSSWYDISNNCR